MSVFTHLVAELGRLLEPVLAESATAAAIVLFTVLVRLALHPLSRAAFRGATPVAGCLPLLLQLPVFFLMYQAFTSGNELLSHRLFAAPLGSRWTDALGEGGPFGAQGLVFLALFGAIAVVAAWSAVRGRRSAAAAAAAAAAAPKKPVKPVKKAGTGAGAGAAGLPEPSAEQQEAMRKLGGVLPLLSFGTLITAAVVPLAAGLYLLTTTAWSVAERVWLEHRKARVAARAAADRPAGGAVRSSL
ncbi:YidC/Oxa1 family membrane protein insertase [Streptomyces erythrochromogenes]|uniref:YidC/Oxa1 family membrane protein insertase n=1 Tax=Streptomyces erythrochromogenes TaxID=285574 RepID=UPI0036C171B2